MIEIYVDGSCKKNPKGTGGFGVVVVKDGIFILTSYQKFSDSTTNNREEMEAIIFALENYGVDKDSFHYPIVYSDSQYCVKTFTDWMFKWKANGWVRPNNQKVENLDLVKKFDKLLNEGKRIDLRKVKGHSGQVYNELADELATGKRKADNIL